MKIFSDRQSQARDPLPILGILKEARGKVAYDVGANVGAVSEILSNNFERVFSFEPASESYTKLVAHNNPRVTPFNIAVSNVNGIISLEIRQAQIKKGQLVSQGIPGFDWGEPDGIRLVPALTLDALASCLPEPDFVKIDTEGHELKVVEGAKRLLSKSRAILLIEVHDKNNGEQIDSLLSTSHNLRLIRHSGHTESSEKWNNHYFLVASPR